MKLGISKDLKEQMEKKNISMFTDERWNDNADAVSYTHLDVYKRQSLIWLNLVMRFTLEEPNAEHCLEKRWLYRRKDEMCIRDSCIPV